MARYVGNPGWFADCVQAIIAALMQEGVIAWNGDATSIVAQIVLAQAQARDTAEARATAAEQALEEAMEALDECANVLDSIVRPSENPNALRVFANGIKAEYRARQIIARSRHTHKAGEP